MPPAISSRSGPRRKTAWATSTIVGAFVSKMEYLECWKYMTQAITSKIEQMTHMTQNMRQLIALIPYSPVTQKAPMRTTKIMLMALHQSEITNFPMTRAIRRTSTAMRTGRIRMAYSVGTMSIASIGNNMAGRYRGAVQGVGSLTRLCPM